MQLAKENVDKFIKFLNVFMNSSRKQQLNLLKKIEKELNSKCSKS
jgi:hypothetical protein